MKCFYKHLLFIIMTYNNNNVEFDIVRVFSLGQNPKQTRRLIMVYKIHLFIVRY